ncbi:DUF2059 domain-containing protein [Stappia sp. F7233]|uniref:DUF2059 domain-containing protein n=1 Tax=Stappia albiluteola TaxID=2758565 RepID=A0A839ALQ0_9HYPH|nr:DUF2059 domain-containing protein [Stappia albiluteola]MBA5779359.1 DUF2059 domain-containing protein [Stappia albiluteola]
MFNRAYKRIAGGLAVALSAAVLATGAFAQEQKKPEPVSETHLQAAKEAVLAAKVLTPYDNFLPLIAEQTRTLFVRSNPSAGAEIDEVVNEVALNMVEKRPELNQIVYEVWARRFSEEELKEIAAFYNSPVGQKFSDLGGELTALSVGAGKQWSDRISAEMVSIVRDELKKRGYID